MENLTISNAVVLASIIAAAQGNQTVKWLDNDTVFFRYRTQHFAA